MEQKNAFCAWSGGKSSCLALSYALKTDHIVCLFSTFPRVETGTLFHPLSPALLRAQADLLKIPLLVISSNADDYEKELEKVIVSLKKYDVTEAIFGNTSHLAHRESLQSLCQKNNVSADFPLWNKNKNSLLFDFFKLGFKAKLVAVNEKYLSRDFLGKDLSSALIEEFEHRKIDVFGSGGEYHTIVYDGPLFSQRLELKEGDVNLRGGYWTLDVSIA